MNSSIPLKPGGVCRHESFYPNTNAHVREKMTSGFANRASITLAYKRL